MRIRIANALVMLFAMGFSGCQSWSQLGQSMPSGSRVPPPGTGTFQVPSSYYNNGAAPRAGSVSDASPASAGTNSLAKSQPNSNPSAVITAGASMPAIDQMRGVINNSASNIANEFQTGANQVVQAGARGASEVLQTGSNRASEFIQNGTSRIVSSVDSYTDSAPSLRSASAPAASGAGVPATRSLSDTPPGDVQLNWQTPK